MNGKRPIFFVLFLTLCVNDEQKNQKVMDGEAVVTIMDSATAEYQVLNQYCGLALLSDTYNPQHCECHDPSRRAVDDEHISFSCCGCHD